MSTIIYTKIHKLNNVEETESLVVTDTTGHETTKFLNEVFKQFFTMGTKEKEPSNDK